MERHIFLENVRKGRESNILTVRIVRKWTLTENTSPNRALYVGLVLADARGNVMYGEIPNQIIEAKAHLVDIGKVYQIKRVRIANARKLFRPVDGTFMMEFTEFTIVELVANPPAGIPEIVYTLTPFDALQPVSGPVEKYTDVLGYITKYSGVSSFVPRNRERAVCLREVYMKDFGGNELKVTLWGEKATEFNIDDIYDDQADKVFLSGSAACFYYFNPQIAETEPYRSRFRDTPVYIERPPPEEERIGAPVQDVPLQQKTISELNSIPPFSFQDGVYKCAATISSIPHNVRWWYMSCETCKKAEQQIDHTYRCPNGHNSRIMPRYILSFIGKDDTDEARFFAYDEEAKQIVQRDCESILNPLALPATLPAPLQKIIDKKYVFGIDLPDESSTTMTDRQYVVRSVLEKPPRRPLPGTADSDRSALKEPGAGPSTLVVDQGSGSSVQDLQPVGSTISTDEVTQAVQLENEVPQVRPATQTTPTPSVHTGSSLPKDNVERAPSKARKGLLPHLDIADKGTSATTHTETGEPKAKRQRSTSTKQTAKEGSSKSACPTTKD